MKLTVKIEMDNAAFADDGNDGRNGMGTCPPEIEAAIAKAGVK